jgi:type I restriction enzyme S subunit
MESDWSEYTIGDVLTLQRGFDITKKEQVAGNVPVVSSGGIKSFHAHAKVKAPGVVLGRKGTLGTTFFLNEDFWPHDTTLWVKDFKGNNARFVYYFFRNIAEVLQSLDVGTSNPALNRNHVHPVEMRLPPLTEQKAIAHVLGSLDDKIELNRRMNETLEGMAQALFKSWFEDFDPVLDNALAADNPIPEELAERAEVRQQALADGSANREVAKAFPAAFQFDAELGWIPEGWKIQRLYNIANFINGAAYRGPDFTDAPDALPVIKIAEIKNGISGQTKFTHIIKDEKYKISDGEILLSWSGNPDTSIGTFLWMGGEGWLNQHIFKVSLKNEIERFFVYYQLKSLQSVFAEIARDKQTTGLGHFTAKDMKRLRVFKPSTELLNGFNNSVTALYQRFYQNRLSEKTLSNLRDTLLPKLISGELRIPDAEKLVKEALT